MNTKSRHIAVFFLALLIVSLFAVPMSSNEAYAAGNDYTYDTRYAGFLGRGLIHDSRFDNSTKRYGIDVSSHQGKIDWKKVAEAGTEFAFIRVAFRGYESGKIVEDKCAQYNITEALKYGIKVGVYIYSQAINVKEARAEADFVTSALKRYGYGPKSITLPVVFDVEFPCNKKGQYTGRLYRAKLSKKARTNVTLAFLESVEKAGYTGSLYGSRSALKGEIKCDMSEISGKYPVWLAAYTSSKQAGYKGQYEFWQYSCKGKVPGISTPVDLNVWYDQSSKSSASKAAAANATAAASVKVAVSSAKSNTGWKTVNGRIYYVDPATGKNVTGWKKIDEKQYFFSLNANDLGAMRIGWRLIDGKRYHFDENGVMQTGWQTIDGKRYFFSLNAEDLGAMRTGFRLIDGKRYYFDAKGVMLTGWQTINKRTYYFDPDGVMASGWKKIGGKTYFFSTNASDRGAMRRGWRLIDDKRYYFNNKGEMQTGWVRVSGKWYYLNNNGSMARNTWIGRYYVNNKGVRTKTR